MVQQYFFFKTLGAQCYLMTQTVQTHRVYISLKTCGASITIGLIRLFHRDFAHSCLVISLREKLTRDLPFMLSFKVLKST